MFAVKRGILTRNFVVTVFVAFAASAFAEQTEKIALDAMLPPGDVAIEFMDVGMGQRGNALAEKLMSNTDSKWLQKYIASVAKPGEPLPYHEKFGLSEAEYQEFLKATSERKLLPTGTVWNCRIEIEKGFASIVPVDHRSATLRSIKIHLPTSHAMASDVKLGPGKWRTRPTPDSAIGPWRGYLWEVESSVSAEELAAGADFRIAELDLLHQIDTEYVLVRHKIQQRVEGEVRVSKELMFRFRVPGIQDRSSK